MMYFEILSGHLRGSLVLLNMFRVESKRTKIATWSIGPRTINMILCTK